MELIKYSDKLIIICYFVHSHHQHYSVPSPGGTICWIYSFFWTFLEYTWHYRAVTLLSVSEYVKNYSLVLLSFQLFFFFFSRFVFSALLPLCVVNIFNLVILFFFFPSLSLISVSLFSLFLICFYFCHWNMVSWIWITVPFLEAWLVQNTLINLW